MEQCNLNGNHVALLLRAMCRSRGQARELNFHLNANKLERGISEIAKAIKEDHTPSHLVMRMIEFEKEDHFRQILEALRTNTTIRSLDLSKASLPTDANPETCETLRSVFAENNTLEDFDISGEQSHLEVTRFGIGLNHALKGLGKNKALKVLRIEHQNLGLEGANTLSTVLEENTCLTHIHCEHNDINLQGFTVLVNAMATNYSLLEFPFMQNEQDASMKRISSNMKDTRAQATKQITDTATKSSVRKSISSFAMGKPQPVPEITPQDVDAVVRLLAEQWDTQNERMSMFLERNRNIANGIPPGSDGEIAPGEDDLRPATALSDNGILENALKDTTPRADQPNPVDVHMSEKLDGLGISAIEEVHSDQQPLLENQREKQDGIGRENVAPSQGSDGGFSQPPTPAHLQMFEDFNGGFFKMDSED